MKNNIDKLKEHIILMTIFANKKVGVAIFVIVAIFAVIASGNINNIDYYALFFLYLIMLFIVTMVIRKDMIENGLDEYEYYLITNIKLNYIVNRLNKILKFYDIENNKLY